LNRDILLVDDVFTAGTTASEICASSFTRRSGAGGDRTEARRLKSFETMVLPDNLPEGSEDRLDMAHG
jgi:hypothetical protein